MEMLKRVKEYTGALGAHGRLTFIYIPIILIFLLFLKMLIDVLEKEKGAKITPEKVAKTILNILIGLFTFIMVYDTVFIFSLRDENVMRVRNACPKYFENDGITYEKALNYYAKDLKWDAYTAEGDIEVVNAEGKFKYSEKHTDFSLQFSFSEDMTSIKARAMRVDDKDVSPEAMDYFIFSMFVSCRDDSPMYFDVDDIPDLDTLDSESFDENEDFDEDNTDPLEDMSSAPSELKEEKPKKENPKPEKETRKDDEEKIIGTWLCAELDLVYVFDYNANLHYYISIYEGSNTYERLYTFKYSLLDSKLSIVGEYAMDEIKYQYFFVGDDTLVLYDYGTKYDSETDYVFVRTDDLNLISSIFVEEYPRLILGKWCLDGDEDNYITLAGDMIFTIGSGGEETLLHYALEGEMLFVDTNQYKPNEPEEPPSYIIYTVQMVDEDTLILGELDNTGYPMYYKTYYRREY